jgi:hypothetical protein
VIDRLPLILLLAGCALCGGILASELTSPTSETEAAAGGEQPSVATPLSPAQSGPGTRPDVLVAEILARPLFSSTRRPPPHSDGPAADTGLSDTRLAGIVTAPGRRFAIFAPTGAKPVVVSEGDTISGWRVENITPRQVSLSGPEGTKTLQPRIDPNLLPPPPPPSAAASSPSPARPVAAAAPRPGLQRPFPNRPPPRPGLLRQRQ